VGYDIGVACSAMKEMKSTYEVLIRKPKTETAWWRPWRRWEDNEASGSINKNHVLTILAATNISRKILQHEVSRRRL
jgi:hypothetical protein